MSFGINQEQLNKIQVAYNIGKTIKASDGTTFEHTLPSIMGQESSWGKVNLGDRYRKGKLQSKYKMSFGNYQVKISTAKETIKKYKHLHKKYGFLVEPKYKDSLMKLLRYNHRFCAEIAGHYLLSMYEQALKRGYSKPYIKAVGRYNGGWNNKHYPKLVLKRMKTVKKLKKEGKLI
jgi:hypothetical protein